MRIFLDANVLFSAGNAGSPTARVVRLPLDRAEAVTCEYALEEARRNIELKRPTWAADFAALMPAIKVLPTHVFALPVKLIEKDIPILCSAIRSNCTYLVTSDRRDFGHLYNLAVHGVTVITLLRLAELLAEGMIS
jgi:predicted nucleic acid-binding protein